MTTGSAAEVVAARLQEAGFRREPRSFRVTSYAVEFSAVLSGEQGRSSDLVVILATDDEALVGEDGMRAVQRLEALTLALDIANWPVVVSAILAGPPLPPAVIEDIGRSCRTLTVTDETTEGIDDAPSLDDRLSVLLPLIVDDGGAVAADPIARVIAAMRGAPGNRLAMALVDASARGEDEVRKTLAREVDQAMLPGLRA